MCLNRDVKDQRSKIECLQSEINRLLYIRCKRAEQAQKTKKKWLP